MTLILYILFGLLPSLIWLFFYLKKDKQPESKKMIIKVFFFGMLAAIGAAAVEISISKFFLETKESKELAALYPLPSFFLYHFLLVSFVEEMAKFLVVKIKVLKSSEFDEPVDAMLYMIIAALGFAALENLLYIAPLLIPGQDMSLFQAGAISFIRFLGATFLHALSSGVIGFFLAYSIFKKKHKLGLLSLGIALAVLLHGLFNISIIGIEGGLTKNNNLLLASSIAFLIGLLSMLAIAVSWGFIKLKKTASVCKLK